MPQTRSQSAKVAVETEPLLAQQQQQQQQLHTQQQPAHNNGDADDAGQPSTSGRPRGSSSSLQGKEDVFHKGVAISMWQNSGDDDSNWTNFIKSSFPFAALPIGFNRFSGKYSVLQNCPDTWNRFVCVCVWRGRGAL